MPKGSRSTRFRGTQTFTSGTDVAAHDIGKIPFFDRRYIFKWWIFQPVMLVFLWYMYMFVQALVSFSVWCFGSWNFWISCCEKTKRILDIVDVCVVLVIHSQATNTPVYWKAETPNWQIFGCPRKFKKCNPNIYTISKQVITHVLTSY